MVWGRHDPFFELTEVLSWMQALPRMEAHVLDAGHKLLETHAAAAVSLRDAQLTLAREYGFAGWRDLTAEVRKRVGNDLEWALAEAHPAAERQREQRRSA